MQKFLVINSLNENSIHIVPSSWRSTAETGESVQLDTFVELVQGTPRQKVVEKVSEGCVLMLHIMFFTFDVYFENGC